MGEACYQAPEIIVGRDIYKENWPVVHCVLLMWHSGTTGACIDTGAGSLCLCMMCLGGGSVRKAMMGVVCIWPRAFTHMSEIHTAPTEK